MATDLKKRIYKFDNIKFAVILLVVLGHVIESYTGKSDMFKSLWLFIYSFHMPLFIFLSGLFQKRFEKGSKFNTQKFTYYIILGFILKLLLQFVYDFFTKTKEKLDLLGGQHVEWFMFALAMYMLFAYIVQRIHPAIVLSFSVVAALVGGYFWFIGDFMYSSRTLVFMPFFFLGYYLTPEKVMDFTNKIYIKIGAIAVLVIYFVLCFRERTELYKLRRLFTGRNSYAFVSEKLAGCSPIHRLLCYGISLVLCIAVIAIVPNIKIPLISSMGANTLSVYFWHNPCIYIAKYFGLFALMLKAPDPLWKILIIAFALILGFVLSFPIFNAPLKALNRLIQKIPTKACIITVIAIFVVAAVLRFFVLV